MKTSPIVESVLQRLSPHFIALKLKSVFFEFIRIQIRNENGESKISFWEELNSGKNRIAVDLSSLCKGNYFLTISDSEGKTRVSESFTL